MVEKASETDEMILSRGTRCRLLVNARKFELSLFYITVSLLWLTGKITLTVIKFACT